jgi:hypothetical protein
MIAMRVFYVRLRAALPSIALRRLLSTTIMVEMMWKHRE